MAIGVATLMFKALLILLAIAFIKGMLDAMAEAGSLNPFDWHDEFLSEPGKQGGTLDVFWGCFLIACEKIKPFSQELGSINNL